MTDEAEKRDQQIDPPAPAAATEGKKPVEKEPAEGVPVIQIWVEEDNSIWLKDGKLGPDKTCDYLARALRVAQMPFFFREMVGELVKMSEHHQGLLKKAIAEHELNVHGMMLPTDGARNPDGTPANLAKLEGAQSIGTAVQPESQPGTD